MTWIKWSSQTLKNHTADWFRTERARLRYITVQAGDAGAETSFYDKVNRMMPRDFDWGDWAKTADRNERATEAIAAAAQKVDSGPDIDSDPSTSQNEAENDSSFRRNEEQKTDEQSH